VETFGKRGDRDRRGKLVPGEVARTDTFDKHWVKKKGKVYGGGVTPLSRKETKNMVPGAGKRYLEGGCTSGTGNRKGRTPKKGRVKKKKNLPAEKRIKKTERVEGGRWWKRPEQQDQGGKRSG